MFRKVIGPLASRPRLVAAAAIGVGAWLALTLIPNDLSWSTRAVAGWDSFCFSFIIMALAMMADCDSSKIKARAAGQDEGQHAILLLAMVAAVASVAAIAAELTLAKNEQGLLKTIRVATMASSRMAC